MIQALQTTAADAPPIREEAMSAEVRTYASLKPPGEVTLFNAAAQRRPQHVDYAAHPAYAPLIAKQSPAARASAAARFVASAIPLAAKRLIDFELISTDVRTDRSVAGRARFLRHGIRNALGMGRKRTGKRGSGTIGIAGELARQGCSVVVLPPSRIDEVEQISAHAFATLAARRAAKAEGGREFEESRLAADRRHEASLYDVIDAVLEESGIIAAASEYLGRSARLVDVNPQINDPSDSFWRDIFPDRSGDTLPRSAYFHRDASGGDLKAIFYLTSVGPQNGPFSYVLGSHSVPFSRFDNFVCEANDHNGFGATDLDARRRFAALPRKLRQKGAFGNDLRDGAPASDEILRSAWSITGPKGAIVLFDTKGIHRGGMVETGERRVITCIIG